MDIIRENDRAGIFEQNMGKQFYAVMTKRRMLAVVRMVANKIVKVTLGMVMRDKGQLAIGIEAELLTTTSRKNHSDSKLQS